jgi:peptidyl-tRNA hydrolase
MKLYIAVLDQVPSFIVPTLVAHSVLSAHIKFSGNTLYDEWLVNSFKKCIVKVNQKEFNKIRELECHEGYENKTLDGTISCLVVKPMVEYPNVIKFSKLWKP